MSCRGKNEEGLYNGRARFSASFEAKWKQARTAGFWMFYSSLWLRSDWRKILDVLGEKKKFLPSEGVDSVFVRYICQGSE